MSEVERRSSIAGGILVLGALLLVAMEVAVVNGSARVSLGAAIGGDTIARTILFDVRLPRVILAALVGAILGMAGSTFQTLLRNPFADPFILGVSGGAAAGAAIATAAGLNRFPGIVSAIAFLGACAATAAVFLLARRRQMTDPTRLLLSGLVLNAFFSAIILMAFALSSSSDLTAALRWMMGTLFSASWGDVLLLAIFAIAGLVVLTTLANDMRMLSFGEEDAKSRGVNVEGVKLAGFATGSIITGAAVAVSGIIGFVGLLVPHLVRLIWRSDYRVNLPLSALAGAILIVVADLVSRTLVTATELPIGAFTALLGVPFFLSLLRRGR